MLARGTGRQRPIWRISVRCASWHDAGNIARTCHHGLLVTRCPDPEPVGLLVELTVELPDGIKVDLRGWVKELRAEGAGIEFDRRPVSGLILLERLIQEEMGAPQTPRTPTTYSMVRRPRTPVAKLNR
jgi:hypothetical protein